jgi:anti-sigma regulatory factor (Ser/Thr protein kinase)
MRRLVEKFSKNRLGHTELRAPSLHPDLSFSEFIYMNKRGYLAKKLSNYLGLPTDETNAILYLSLTKKHFMDYEKEIESEFILHLSEQMLTWNEEQKDIPREIKSLDSRAHIQNAMLKAYEMFHNTIFRMPVKKQDQRTKTEDKTWHIYRDVISAVTQEKFSLITNEEVIKYKEGTVFCDGTIKTRSDIPTCRTRAKEALEIEGFSNSTIMSWLLVLSEAITNTIKHAEEGKMTLIKDAHEVRFVIEDNGPGFSLEELPKMTLQAGYSTKKSMGQGFTLMMKMANRVLLYTSPKGAILILCFDINK